MGSDGDAYESLDRAFMHVIALDAINRENIARRFARKFISAVAGTNRNS